MAGDVQQSNSVKAADPAAGAAGEPTGGGYRYYVLFMLMMTYMFNITDRMVMSILIEDIKADFALTDTQIGLLAGLAFTIFYVALGIPAGRLADRTNRKTMVACAVSLWSIMAALCGAAIGFWTLFLARLGVGVGEAGGNPPAVSTLTDYFAPHELSKAMGIFSLGAALGPSVGFIAGGWLAEVYGWRWTFIILGLPGVLLGLIVYLTVREPERGRFYADKTRVGADRQQPFRETMRSMLGNAVFVRVVLANSVAIMTAYAFSTFLAPMLIRNFEVKTSEVGLLLGIVWLLGGIPGMVLGGMITDRLAARDPRWRAWFCAATILASLIPLSLSLLAETMAGALAFYTIGYALLVAAQGPTISMVQSAVLPTERGTASSIAGLSATATGYAIGLFIVGAISDAIVGDYGSMSLNYAVLALTVATLIPASVMYLWAARALPVTEAAPRPR